MEQFYLEEPSKEREEQAYDYIFEFLQSGSQINGVGGLDRYLGDYEDWLKKLKKQAEMKKATEKMVPARTYYLVRSNDDRIVGMINIRLELNEMLKRVNGNIGYSIRPTERRKGYNKVNLYLGLKVLQEYGKTKAMLSCLKDNLGSAKSMIALGAILQREFYDEKEQGIEQIYEIDVNESLEKYKDVYEPFVYKRTK